MVWKEKLLKKFLENPQGVTYMEMENLLLKLGFEKASVRGSHRKFRHLLLEKNLIIPVHNRDCKKFYKKMVAKIIKTKII